MSLFSKKTTDDDQIKDKESKSAKLEVVKKDKSLKQPKVASMKDLYDGEAEKMSVEGDKESIVKRKKGGNFEMAYRVLVKPLVTEKATNLSAQNKYAFEVSRQANKISVGKAIEEVYKIKPLSINIIQCRGKKVSYGKNRGQKKNWKKAIITLPKEKSINIYEGV